mmetsp:Transcript_39809/g.84867  ORF Transcript_39809/g.84867 Transcript_39809/m.84867 type:complete len:129 (-) Transcript_39809:617-1003(-)
MQDSDDEDGDFAPAADRKAQCKAHLTQAVFAIIDAEQPHLDLEISKAFAHQLAQLVWEWTTNSLAPDLELFVRHRGRAIVGMEDVQLAARRNPRTKELIDAVAQRLRQQKSDAAESKRRSRDQPNAPP